VKASGKPVVSHEALHMCCDGEHTVDAVVTQPSRIHRCTLASKPNVVHDVVRDFPLENPVTDVAASGVVRGVC